MRTSTYRSLVLLTLAGHLVLGVACSSESASAPPATTDAGAQSEPDASEPAEPVETNDAGTDARDAAIPPDAELDAADAAEAPLSECAARTNPAPAVPSTDMIASNFGKLGGLQAIPTGTYFLTKHEQYAGGTFVPKTVRITRRYDATAKQFHEQSEVTVGNATTTSWRAGTYNTNSGIYAEATKCTADGPTNTGNAYNYDYASGVLRIQLGDGQPESVLSFTKQ